ncbi:hypothetical protein ABZ612_34820 [Streptomyces avermitilis]|uniref:hypothetical protein n=1 Tax=Streptomyces avermitilis TaxID=33903 RepID=UPI0033F1091A
MSAVLPCWAAVAGSSLSTLTGVGAAFDAFWISWLKRHQLVCVQPFYAPMLVNARKYAPGPCLLDLEGIGGRVEVTV